MDYVTFALAVLSYCHRHQASVTSWIRTPEHNTQVGGVERSPHLLGFAVDVVYDTPTSIAAREATAKNLNLRVIPEGDHDHLQPADWKAHV